MSFLPIFWFFEDEDGAVSSCRESVFAKREKKMKGEKAQGLKLSFLIFNL